MSYQASSGDSMYSIAQRLLGDSRRWQELSGYSGDPNSVPIGTVIYMPGETGGPPAQPPQDQPASAPSFKTMSLQEWQASAGRQPTSAEVGGVGVFRDPNLGFTEANVSSRAQWDAPIQTVGAPVKFGNDMWYQVVGGGWIDASELRAGAPTVPGSLAAAAWGGIPPEYRNQLTAMEHEWESMGGYRVPISDQDLLDMAHNGVSTMSEFGKFMWGRMSAADQQNMPWLQYGIDHDTFSRGVTSAGDVFFELTGQQATPEVLAQALADSPGGSLDVNHFRQKLIHDKNMRSTYGWIEYGMNFDEFDRFKKDNATAYGHTLGDQEAVNIIKEQHEARASGASASRSEATFQKPNKEPVGATQSAVR